MRIMHINTYDCVGGAARAAYRLHDGLRRIGQQSRMLVLEKISCDPSVIQYDPPKDPLNRALRALRRVNISLAGRLSRRKVPKGLGFLSDDRSRYGRDPWRHLPESELIHLHWIDRFLNYQAFFDVVPATKPVIWTLHDMAAFTGGCHYDEGCNRFSQACGC